MLTVCRRETVCSLLPQPLHCGHAYSCVEVFMRIINFHSFIHLFIHSNLCCNVSLSHRKQAGRRNLCCHLIQTAPLKTETKYPYLLSLQTAPLGTDTKYPCLLPRETSQLGTDSTYPCLLSRLTVPPGAHRHLCRYV